MTNNFITTLKIMKEKDVPRIITLNKCDNDKCPNNLNISLGLFILKLMNCGACHVVSYCSVECQRAAWFLHKQECRYIKQFHIDKFRFQKLCNNDDFKDSMRAKQHILSRNKPLLFVCTVGTKQELDKDEFFITTQSYDMTEDIQKECIITGLSSEKTTFMVSYKPLINCVYRVVGYFQFDPEECEQSYLKIRENSNLGAHDILSDISIKITL